MSKVRLAVALVALSGCGGQQLVLDNGPDEATDQAGALTWSGFLSRVYQVPGQDVFVVNGDTTVEGWKNLRDFYELAALGNQKLIIDQWGGVDARWTDSQKRTLTYCVSSAFGARHALVVQAMAEAAGSWQAVADVRYQYLPAQDGNCNIANQAVLFDVRPVQVNGQFLARAFFPGDSRGARSVEIDGTGFTQGNNPSLAGLLRHELGHTLGFRHEHTRPEAGTCFEDNNWRQLTTYDAASVMHYPQCNGAGDWTLTLTAQDIAGARAVYGPPGGPSAPPPAVPSASTWNGSVNKGQTSVFPVFAVKPGTTFTVELSGTGDPDLYVRFGAAPTATQFSCRPYLDGPNETCTLTVPAGKTQAFVQVVGYAASNFSATVSWTAP